MASAQTNLQVGSRSRTKPKSGDIFAMQLPSNEFLFGRVIGADLDDQAPMPGSYLVYIYNLRLSEKIPQPDRLVSSSLLLPPVFTNRMPWTKGYFENVGHQSVQPGERSNLALWDALRKRYVDDCGAPVPGPTEPTGTWGLVSYRWIDDRISDALGIPRAPEE